MGALTFHVFLKLIITCRLGFIYVMEDNNSSV